MVRDRFGGMGRFNGGLSFKGNIINVITEMYYICDYMQVFF